MRVPASLAAAAAAVVLAACGGGGSTAAPTEPSPSRPTPSPCPSSSASSKPAVWPRQVPADLPKPPGAVIEKVDRTSSGVTVVRFSVPSSLSNGVLFVVNEFKKHGYVIGRGDAEVTEADAPFQRGRLRGLVRILSKSACSTLWLMAVGTTGGAPFAPNYSPPPSASPLPFG